jgi:hypothetical protein
MPVAGNGGGVRSGVVPVEVPEASIGTGAGGSDWARAVASDKAEITELTINQLDTRRII